MKIKALGNGIRWGVANDIRIDHYDGNKTINEEGGNGEVEIMSIIIVP